MINIYSEVMKANILVDNKYRCLMYYHLCIFLCETITAKYSSDVNCISIFVSVFLRKEKNYLHLASS